MAKNKYISIMFNQGVRQDVPKALLPLPFLTKAQNFIVRDQGRLESRPFFKELKELPKNSGTPLKLFTYNDSLFCFTDRYTMIYEKSQNKWRDIISHQVPPTTLGETRNVSSEVYPILQKEKDIRNLAFASFAENLAFFYTYPDSPYSPATIFYTVFSPIDKRVIEPERQLVIKPGTSAPTGIFAVENTEIPDNPDAPKELILGVSYSDSIYVVSFDPIRASRFSLYTTRNIAGIRAFKIHRDRVYYTTDGTTVGNFVFNENARLQANINDVTINDFRDPSSHALGSLNQTLWDFHNWVDFSYRKPGETQFENFKMVWSLNTGYFLLDNNNRILAHLYANLLPEDMTNPPRVRYYGDVVIKENIVYVPILRSGQIEAVNREAITDRILPQGTEELVAFRPLGLELLALNMESKESPETAKIGRQLLISGPVLKWYGGVRLSEYSFTEKPNIEKTPNADYDRWAYSDLSVELQPATSLNRTQYNEVVTLLNRRKSPFLVEEVTFTAGSSGDDIGIGVDYGSWATESTTAKRTLRYSSNTSDGSIDKEYGGVLSRIYYDDSEKALVVVYTSAPETLESGFDHPQGIQISGITYLYDSIINDSGTLTCYNYMSASPLKSGDDYTVEQLYADVLRSPSELNRDVQLADADNQNTNIKLNEVKLRKFQKIISSTSVIDSGLLSTVTIDMVQLNGQNHVGAFSRTGVRDTVGVLSGAQTLTRDSARDKNFGSGNWDGVFFNGTTIWGLRNSLNTMVAYNFSTLARDSSKDISLGSDSWSGLVYTATTFWIIQATRAGFARAYNASTLARDSSKDISLGRGFWRTGVSDGTTLWFVDEDNGRARAYNASTLARDSSKDISLGTDSPIYGAFSDGTTLWFNIGHIGMYRAYNASTLARDSSKDISSRNRVAGGVSDGTNLFIVLTDSRAIAYTLAFTSLGNGTLTNNNITSKLELSGIWSDRSKLFLLFSALTSDYATGALLKTEIQAQIDNWVYRVTETNFYNTLRSAFTSSTTTFYTIGGRIYVRYEMSDFPTAQSLRNIILNAQLAESDNTFTITFNRPSGRGYAEVREDIDPQIISAVYSVFDENGSPKEATVDDIKNNITIYRQDQQTQYSDFLLNTDTFNKVKGSVDANNYYSMRTTDNPLLINTEVLNFEDETKNVRVRYPLVDVAPVLTAQRELLNARVYNYFVRFKWIDESGLEHRSQISKVLQIISNRDIGIPGNQPTFRVNHLNLTNKPAGSVIIEIYRTKKNSRTLQLMKEIQPIERAIRLGQYAVFTDDVEDSQLGQIMGNDNIVLSGAKHTIPYQGRFVLFGFPDKPNRILISSQENPFSNQAIAFQVGGILGGTIEILMEENIVDITVLDSYLIIFCETQTYTWSIRENSIQQKTPAKITGLSSYTVSGVSSSVETSQGLLFNSDRGRGIQLLTRGLTWHFAGEPVKKATTKGNMLATLRKDENIIFIKESNEEDPDQPQVLIYNQRYNVWTSYDNRDLVSGVIWDKKFTALSVREGRGTVWQEDVVAPANPGTENFVIETGWLNLTDALIGYQRLRDIYLLATFEGLEGLSLYIDYNFVPGYMFENIKFKLSGYVDSPVIAGGPVAGGTALSDKREFRFQPRNQGGTAVRLKFTISARTAKLHALRLGGDWQRLTGTQTQRSSQSTP